MFNVIMWLMFKDTKAIQSTSSCSLKRLNYRHRSGFPQEKLLPNSQWKDINTFYVSNMRNHFQTIKYEQKLCHYFLVDRYEHL